jgi:hypothetical protein
VGPADRLESQGAIAGQDRALVVPADVALGRADRLALLVAGQRVRATGAEERATLTDPQFQLDRRHVHRTPPPVAGL